jgi:hypothetical protein
MHRFDRPPMKCHQTIDSSRDLSLDVEKRLDRMQRLDRSPMWRHQKIDFSRDNSLDGAVETSGRDGNILGRINEHDVKQMR